MLIKFKNFGENFSTRRQGTAFRELILSNLKEGKRIQFDFQDVFMISNSFADECFGKLLLEIEFENLRSRTTFINTEGLIKNIISYAIKQRLNELVH